MRDITLDGKLIMLSAVDPLNFSGILTPGERIPAKHTIQIIYQDGLPVAYSHHGQLHALANLSEEQIFTATQLLHRQHRPLPQPHQDAVH